MASQLPNFLVIGAARSGTTALYQALAKHPEIFMSAVKEPNFFAFAEGALDFAGPGADFVNNSVTTFDKYRGLFADAAGAKAVGEASPLYLYSPQAPRRIAETLGPVKLVAVLRNPADQAFSHYLYARAQMIEPLGSFEEALAAEPERAAACWQPLFQYSSFPHYGEQLARFLEHFGRENLLVHTYDDFVANPDAIYRSIFTFLGVDASFAPPGERVNMGGVPRNAGLQRFIMRPSVLSPVFRKVLPDAARQRLRDQLSGSNIVRPPFPAALRRRLLQSFSEDIGRTERLIGRDLSHWLDERGGAQAHRSVAG
jgi:hypothetical protein